MNSHKITNLLAPTAPTDAARLVDVQNVLDPTADSLATLLAANGGGQYVGMGAGHSLLQLFTNALVVDYLYTTLELALVAATGKTLLLTQDWTTATGYTVPANTKVLGFGGSVTTTAAIANAFELGGDGCVIEDVDIIGPFAGTEPGASTQSSGIYGLSRDHIGIHKCRIRGFNNSGIFLINYNNATITENRLWGNLYNAPRVYGDSTDINLYSNVSGVRSIVAHNHCLSNNSQGIYVNAVAHDSEVLVIGNQIVTCDANGEAEVATGSVVRRSGIVLGYNSSSGGGRFICSNNVIRNIGSAGIYVAATADLLHAILISNNNISLCGFGTLNAGIDGCIRIIGGAQTMLVANNVCSDYRGNPAVGTGAIAVNTSIAGATGLIIGNTIEGSTADGIWMGGTAVRWRVAHNVIHGTTRYDIQETMGTDVGGHTYEYNEIIRTNANFPSIRVDANNLSTKTTTIRGNRLFGSSGTGGTANTTDCAILLCNVNFTRTHIVEDNFISGFGSGITGEQYITARGIDKNIIRRNHFENVKVAHGFGSGTTAGLIVVEAPTYSNVTTKLGVNTVLGGNPCAFHGYRSDDTKVVLTGHTAVPGQGTFVLGDIIWNTAGTVGQPRGWTVSTAGAIGVAVFTSHGNL